MVSLAEEHQKAEKGRREAERRAERAEKALKDKRYSGGSGGMSFGRRMFQSIKSFSRMVSMRTSASVDSNATGIVSTPVSPNQGRKRSADMNRIMKVSPWMQQSRCAPH